MRVEPWLTSVTLPTRTTQTAHLPTSCLNKTRKQMGRQHASSSPPQPPCVSSLAESPGLGVKRCRFEAQLPPTQDQLCAENITGNAEHQGLLWKGPPSMRTHWEPKYNKRGPKSQAARGGTREGCLVEPVSRLSLKGCRNQTLRDAPGRALQAEGQPGQRVGGGRHAVS